MSFEGHFEFEGQRKKWTLKRTGGRKWEVKMLLADQRGVQSLIRLLLG